MEMLREIIEALPCGIADWNKVWGDPWISGSTLVLAYGAACWLILRVGRQSTGRERWLWRLCGFVFLFQVFNTPLDLHAFVLSYGRCLSRFQGWYETRHAVQGVFLTGVFLAAASVLLLTLVVFFRNIIGNLLMVTGVTIAIGMTAVKAVNYHHLEAYYAASYGPFRVADLIELSGIAIAALAALMRSAAWRRARQDAARADPP